MEKSDIFARFSTRFAGFVLAMLLLTLYWSAVAYAQSREDQYGSPTEAVDHANTAGGALSVLPETGGPLILFVGAALISGAIVMALIGRRAGRR